MKKTIIALMALAGVASAASVGYNSMTDGQKSDVAFAWDFSDGQVSLDVGSIDMGSNKWPSSDFLLTSSGTARVGKNGSDPWTARLSGVGSSFTLSFDVNSIPDYGDYWPSDGHYQAIATLYSDGADTYLFNNILIGFDRNNNIVLKTKGENDNGYGGAGDHTIETGLKTTQIKDTTFTLVSDATEKILTLYVNGESVGSVENWVAGNGKSLAPTGFQFGSGFSEKCRANEVEMSNITMWNKALNASEVSSLIVPEPTTATLSLLALAGLAARRRRK
ncbi:MAG: PEP-CTERM sorting domain-containing protein [Akkermansia sp.]|nr:PEP-CTERM sorting domain-containing protein [Akkermansia sp.]